MSPPDQTSAGDRVSPPDPTTPRGFRAWIHEETTSGLLLLTAAVLALVWANSPWYQSYLDLSAITVGPEALHLDLTLADWAKDGLLALFFFVVGVELKHEFAVGTLSKPREAAVPMVAAVGGMVVPALVFALIVGLSEPTALSGWAIPVATDIAFAVAVLAVLGKGLPVGLRTFLLTLAVVDDLLGITVIAIFYSAGVQLLPLLGALVGVLVFAWVARRSWARWWVLLPLGAVVWTLVHASGVHATVAGVVLGFVVAARPLHGEEHSRTEAYGDLVRPVSNVIALPVFAFFAAGVSLVGGAGLSAFTEPVAIGVAVALVVGKITGVMGTVALITRTTPLRIPGGVQLRELVPVGFLTGIGFTVALLIATLSYEDAAHVDAARVGVLMGSAVAAALAAVSLRRAVRRQRAGERASGSADAEAVPDPVDGER